VFSYFESVRTAQNGSGMTGFRSFHNSMCERVLDLLEAGTSCCGSDVRANIAKLMKMTIARSGKR